MEAAPEAAAADAAAADAAAAPEAAAADAAAAAKAEVDVVAVMDEDGKGVLRRWRGGRPGAGGRKRARRRMREALGPNEQTLRISVSELAVCVGLHPWKNIVEAVERHVYQDLRQLQAEDASRLGMVLQSKEEEVAELMKQTGQEAHQALLAAQRRARSSSALQSVEDVAQAQAAIAAALEVAAKTKRLPKAGMEQIESSLRDALFCGFGRRHEDAALAELERRFGAPVYSRNEECFTWLFPEDASSIGPDRPPVLQRKRRTWAWAEEGGGQGEENKKGGGGEEHETDGGKAKEDGDADVAVVDMVEGDGGAQAAEEEAASSEAEASVDEAVAAAAAAEEDPWRRGPHQFFRVMGSIDGMFDEVDIGPDGEWILRPVVLEVKHRVRALGTDLGERPPPFYEQLQLVTYMLMLEGDGTGAYQGVRGDLVEVLKVKGKPRTREQAGSQLAEEKGREGAGIAADGTTDGGQSDEVNPPTTMAVAAAAAAAGGGGGGSSTASAAEAPASSLPMSVTRITLGGGGGGGKSGAALDHRLDHRILYYQHIVPSLYDYVRFIYGLRSDESLRLAFLAADEETRFGFIVQRLPFVQRPRFSGLERGGSSSRMEEKSKEEAVDVMVVDGEDGTGSGSGGSVASAGATTAALDADAGTSISTEAGSTTTIIITETSSIVSSSSTHVG